MYTAMRPRTAAALVAGLMTLRVLRLLLRRVPVASQKHVSTPTAGRGGALLDYMIDEFNEVCKEASVEDMYAHLTRTICTVLNAQHSAVFVVDEAAGVLRVLRSDGAAEFHTVPLGQGVASAVAAQNKMILLHDARKDCRYSRLIDDPSGEASCILAVPVRSLDRSSQGAVVAVLQAIDCNEGSSSWSAKDAVPLEVLASMISGVVARTSAYYRAERERLRSSCLLNVATAVHSTEKTFQKTARIIRAVLLGTSSERGSLMLVDAMRQQLCILSTDKETTGLRIPLSTGVAGCVATSGEQIMIDDAYSDSRFDAATDRKSGFTTRNIIAVPIFRNGRVVGVLQALNQMQGKFDEQHAELLAAVALQIASELLPDLLRQLIEVRRRSLDNSTKALLRGHALAEFFAETSEELEAEANEGPVARHSTRPRANTSGAAAEEGEEHAMQRRTSCPAKAKPHPPPMLTQQSWVRASSKSLTGLPSKLSIELLRSDWNLDVFSLQPVELLHVAAIIFEDCGALTHFGVSRESLSRFLSSIASGYHENAYHNFPHAVMVMHSSYLLARAGAGEKCKDQLTRLQVFSLLLAAIGHDIDHPGVNNAFLVATAAPLALCYNDKAVLENHHAATTCSLVVDARYGLLDSLSAEQRKEVRKLVIASILATDMAHHHAMVKELTNLAADEERFEPHVALATFLHLADLSNCVVDWELSKTWARRVCEESSAQAAKEQQLELPNAGPVVDMDGFTEVDLAKRQIFFLDMFIAPLFNAAALLFPGVKSRIEVLEANRGICGGLLADA